MKTTNLNSEPQAGLAKHLSRLDVWGIAFGCIVGWGAFVMPGTTFIPLAGPLGTVVGLAVGTALMMIIGCNYSFLMARRPQPGGVFTFTKEAFGRNHAFLCSWFLSLSYFSIVFLNATALFYLSRTVFGNFFQFGFHYQIAGFDVYGGEILLSVTALAVFGLIFIFMERTFQRLQTIFAVVLLLGVLVITAASLPHVDFANVFSGFGGGSEMPALAVSTIVLLAPWAFAGFDASAFETPHFRFSPKKSLSVLLISIFCGGLVYIALSVVTVSALPQGFSDWGEYLSNLGALSGIESVPSFFAAKSSLGTFGVIAVSVSALAAIFTGIIGSYRASARMLTTMAKERIVPDMFRSTPASVAFVMLVSIAVTFLGRNALNWFVELISLGSVIGFGYTSAAAWKLAIAENRRGVRITGCIGMIVSVAFAVVHMISQLGTVETMETQSFLLWALWSLLGFFFYFRTVRKSEQFNFKGVVTTSTALFCVLVYSTVMWFIRCVADDAGKDNLLTIVITDGIIMLIVIAVGMAVMLYTQDTLRKHHNRLEREKIHAEESSKAKSLFLFNISHDIRTPMNAILGYTYLAQQEPNLPDNIRDYFEKIDASGKHLLSLINDILEMNLIENGRLELHSDEADIREATSTAWDMFRAQMREKKINYTLDTDGVTHPRAVFDRDRFLRVILNLLSNAYKFTPEGGAVSVTLSENPSQNEGESVYVLRVKDTGIGMTKDFTETIYEAFAREQTATVSRTQGTGLGMAITKSIVDAMHGRIELITAQGKGSEFIISLPYRVSDRKTEQQTAAETVRLEGKRVLLVDDMDINRKIATRLLQKIGCEADAACDGKQALDLLTQSADDRYHAILMDIQMPVMDGYQTTAAIRALDNPALRDIPIIAVTANATSEDTQRVLDAGMNAHIAKPIDPSALAETLQKYMR